MENSSNIIQSKKYYTFSNLVSTLSFIVFTPCLSIVSDDEETRPDNSFLCAALKAFVWSLDE